MSDDLWIGLAAGAVAAIVQAIATRWGFVARYKRIVAMGLSIVAGGALTLILHGPGEWEDFLEMAGAALAASQALYALALSKLPA